MEQIFSGRVETTAKQGMMVRINPLEAEGKMHKGKEFVIAGDPRVWCGTGVVALNNKDGTRFSAGYDLSMLEVTDLSTTSVQDEAEEIEKQLEFVEWLKEKGLYSAMESASTMRKMHAVYDAALADYEAGQ